MVMFSFSVLSRNLSTISSLLQLSITHGDDIVICGHITISMLWDNTAYCVKLNGEDLSCRTAGIKWNQLVSGNVKRPYYRKVSTDYNAIILAFALSSTET